MPSMKKLTSIRNLMGTAPQGATLLQDVEEMNESFNISFRDLGIEGASLDDTCLDKLAKDEDFNELKSGKGLRFDPDHGLQFDPMLVGTKEEEEDEEEGEDLFQDNSKKTAAVVRGSLSSRRRQTSVTSRKTVRRSVSGDGTTSRSEKGSVRSRSRRTLGGDGTTRKASSSRRTSERSRRRPTVTRWSRKDKESSKEEVPAEPLAEESTEEESSSSTSGDPDTTAAPLKATPEEVPLVEHSSRRSSNRASISGRRPRMMHRAESIRGGGTLGSFSDQGKSTRKLEASKRDRPSIRVSRASKGKDDNKESTTTMMSSSRSKERDSRRSSERRSSNTATKREPSKEKDSKRSSERRTSKSGTATRREPSKRGATLTDRDAAKEIKGTAGLQW